MRARKYTLFPKDCEAASRALSASNSLPPSSKVCRIPLHSSPVSFLGAPNRANAWTIEFFSTFFCFYIETLLQMYKNSMFFSYFYGIN